MLRKLETIFLAVQIYGAAGIAAFGWAICALLGWDAAPWLPLWFSSALLIYNIDRLRRDPADALNTPLRAAASIRLRWLSAVVALAAGVALLAIPIWRRDWLTFGLAAGGALVSVQYSVPLLGFRLKDIPYLKSFIAPTMVIAAIFGLPWLHEGPRPGALLAAFWAWSYLEFNMILCDLRDLEGDRRCGVASLPVRLGSKATHRLLKILPATYLLLAIFGMIAGSARLNPPWWILAWSAAAYLILLLTASARPRSERFYEWAVEGMLYLPPLIVWITI